MINLDYHNLFKINPSHGLSEDELNSYKDRIAEFLEKIEKRDQGFYKILDNLEEIKSFAKKVKDHYEDIVLCGIGGSALGATCLKEALPNNGKLIVLDNIDPQLIHEIDQKLNYEKTLFIIISKSGTTIETTSQYKYFRQKIEEKNLEVNKHFVFITDPEKGILKETANNENIPCFPIPENVGGRFSVLTAVGLLPAALIGIDVDKLIEGAQKMKDKFLSENFEENLPYQIALTQYLINQKGKNIHVMMPYSHKLFKLADWYRQLLAESIGKNIDTGITPVNALGVTDQHSQSQLYNDGPNDKLITFIEIADFKVEEKIPGSITFNQLINIEKKATEESLTKKDRPNQTITVNSICEESIGGLFLLFEGQIAFLGEFYNINAFDQPGVELSKQITKDNVKQLS